MVPTIDIFFSVSSGFWGFGVLGFWGFGVLGFWGFGVLGERKGEKQSEGDEQKSHVLRSITGSYIVCDSLYEDCLKQIDENSEIFVEEGNENVEHEAKSGNDKINIVLIIAVIVLIIIIILVIIYFVRRLRRVKSQSRTSIKGKKDLKTTTITINMTTQQTLKNEGLPNQI